MARVRSVDFLPELFRTSTNKKFLNSTLDQLIQEPKLQAVQGYIGRKNAPGRSTKDGYVLEPDARRTNYQLEPGITFRDDNGNLEDALSYLGLLDGIKTNGGYTNNHDRLFSSETYSWSPFIDFDKFINYSQYFWLPEGPHAVDVSTQDVFLTDDFDITANGDVYNIDGFIANNPTITLLRGGTYTFNISEIGSPLYIQTQPGVDGTLPWAPNIDSREVLGVTNNGEDNGTITFNVPAADAQSFYTTLTDIGGVDLGTYARMDSIADQLVSDVGSIDGISSMDGLTIVFLDDTPGDAVTLGWVNGGVPLTNQADRYQIFRIRYEDVGGNDYIRLDAIQLVNNLEKFTIQYGTTYSNFGFYKNASGYFEKIPLLTASLSKLYYQDSTNANRFGVINVVDSNATATVDINDIVGQKTYVSPNAVEFTNGLKVKFRGNVIPASYIDQEYYVEGVGTSIQLLPVTDFVVPETYTVSSTTPYDSLPYGVGGFDGTSNAPTEQDYITIKRASVDMNAWTRSNRWFHIDVILKSAEYNGFEAELDNTDRADRPIIEFDENLHLFNYSTVGRGVVDVVDFTETDALSNIAGTATATIDGFILGEGSRVIFAADTDSTVRNKIYVVEMADVDNNGTDEIVLTPLDGIDIQEGEGVVIASGVTQQGTTLYYQDGAWVTAQAKTSVNQPPLFDVFDNDGISFGDSSVYPSTTFIGSKIFSYKEGTGVSDTVLGFPLTYLNIDNLGDIVFENNLYTDTFLYIKDNVTYKDNPVSDGFVRKYTSLTDYTNEISWVKSIETAHQAQIFEYEYDGSNIEIDITPRTDLLIPAVSVTVNGTFVNSSNYTISGGIVTFNSGVIATGDLIEIRVISNDISKVGYYEVPTNLTSNIFNENTSTLTLGTIRNHFNKMVQNIEELEGVINGSNNLRDLGSIDKYGNVIIQQSSPVALTAMFMRYKEYNFFAALKFASRQYEKFKNQLLDWVGRNDVYGMTNGQIIDAAIKEINLGKNLNSAFYWSDMLPAGSSYDETIYDITSISTGTFTTLRTYDFANANDQAILVYHNGTLLIKDTEYTVASDGPRITLLITTTPGDVITIHEYVTTVGANVPSTPSKMGLYPKFKPEIFEDDTYITPQNVIRGHDGSLTVAFGDTRDDVLLEFENRIYNNIKVNDDIPILIKDVVPSAFRTTDYTIQEITEILAPSLLSWLGWNRIDYKTQAYDITEDKTWNYNSVDYKVADGNFKPGHWRGIYQWFYDTDSPHTRPWEMLGFSEEPTWWESRYGAAPYTSGNLVLWDDIEAGLVKDPTGEYTLAEYARPGLTQILPVDSEGNAVMPLQSVISQYTSSEFKKSWIIGDNAPAETAWRRSSTYPFDVQRLFALTKPAQYFSLMADRDRYTYSASLDQYVYDGRHRINAKELDIFDEDNVKNSYINWIVDYNRHFGYESLTQLKSDLANMDINLCHHMASFTDKNSLKIFTDKSSPDSTNNSLLLPDESFDLLLYKNQPVDQLIYSSVLVQKNDDGYSVTGNSTTNPYFEIHPAKIPGRYQEFQIGRTLAQSTKVRVPLEFDYDTIERIPYGNLFRNRYALVDFLAGYGARQEKLGFKFEVQDDSGIVVDWTQMIKEFINWTDQGWSIQSIINLNPSARQLEFERELFIVDDLNNLELNEQPLDQNKEPLDISDFVVDRIDNNFKLVMLDTNVISYLKFNLTSYEHLLVLDNTSIFNDLIFDPVTGVRQHRIKISGFETGEWNGQLDAQGFILNEDNVQEWSNTKSYNRGEIVSFKNQFWSASSRVQPSDTFDFNVWVKTDYDKISKGLLPNLATKSDQMLQFYNNKTANLESDADLMAFGLTGYRTREYLQSLDLEDISQVNIYSDMIEKKGTPDSLNLFKGVTLNNEAVDYEIFENWALKRAQYGATSSRSYFELNLTESKHRANPSLVEIVDSLTDESLADELIPVSKIYKQSEKHSDKNILPILIEQDLDIALPSAGFVSSDNVDISTFELSDLDVNSQIDEGTLIWVAKDSQTDWNVYRASKLDEIIIRAIDNLDGTISLEFNVAHTLAATDIIVVKDFDDLIDGVHTILTASTTTRVEIEGSLAKNQTVIEDVEGDVLNLLSARLDVLSDISGSVFDDKLFSDDTVWINDVEGKNAIYNKSLPYVWQESVENPINAATEFGYAGAQGYNEGGLIIGDPSYDVRGGVYCYSKSGSSDYILSQILFGYESNVSRYGESISFANEWAVVGAPGKYDTVTAGNFVVGKEYEIISTGTTDFTLIGAADSNPGTIFTATGPGTGTGTAGEYAVGVAVIVHRDKVHSIFEEIQFIVSPNHSSQLDPDSDFGKEVELSNNEEWLYVGEPSLNLVHAYKKVDYQFQEIGFIGDGVTDTYDITGAIKVSTAQQLFISVDSVKQIVTTDYTFDGTNVVFVTPPADTSVIKISRLNAASFSGNGIIDTFSLDLATHSLYGLPSTNSEKTQAINVTVDGSPLFPFIDYNVSGTDIVFTKPPATGTNNIVVRLNTWFKFIATIDGVTTYSAVFGDNFGLGLTTTDDGTQLAISAPNMMVDGNTNAGKVIVLNRIVERTIITNDATLMYSIDPSRTVEGVFVNGESLLINDLNVGGDYSVSSNTITLNSSDSIAIGDFLEIDTGDIQFVQDVTATTVNASATFGNSISFCKTKCSLYVGAENDNSGNGSVTRAINTSRMYGAYTATVQNPTIGASVSLRINNIDVPLPAAGSSSDVATAINTVNIPNVIASASNGYLIIELVNKEIDSIANKLDIMPGTNADMAALGLLPYSNVQTLTNPITSINAAHFGHSVMISGGNKLVVSATNGDAIHNPSVPTADDSDILADSGFISADGSTVVENTGVVYTYDLLPGSTQFTEGKLVLGQEIYDTKLVNGALFGSFVDLVDDVLVVGSVNYDGTGIRLGRYVIYENVNKTLSWVPVTVQRDVVDTSLINSIFLYNNETLEVHDYLDYIDPLNGKILGAAKQNLDYMTMYDPAIYNSTHDGRLWGKDQVGQIWWDLDTVRFLDYTLGDIKESSKLWGKAFPGSSVDVYQWTKNSVIPTSYTGEGEVYDTSKYVTVQEIDRSGLLKNTYYYWVKGISTIGVNSHKTLSVDAIASYIESPISSGICYCSLIDQNVIAIYNCKSSFQETKTVLHIEYDKIPNSANIFAEYDLFREGNPTDFLSDSLYKKFQDSLCGVDGLGNLVPDPFLSEVDKYGVNFRPRQSMVIDRFAALKTYFGKVNSILAATTISESRTYPLLESEEPQPSATSGEWDEKVANLEELSFQDLTLVAAGYKYLVESDSDNNGLWSIYEVTAAKTLQISRVQNYDTKRFWSLVNWYAEDFNPFTATDYVVNIYSDLSTLTPANNDVAKVENNSIGSWELYQYIDGAWERVGLENGTIEFDQRLWDYELGRYGWDVEVFGAQNFDERPIIETRNIIRSINEELLIGDLSSQRSIALLSIFNYILAEQPGVDWLFKTSLIDVTQKVRGLNQYAVYQKDNNDYLLDYIKETKPYHTKIKDFLLSYDGMDTVEGQVTDFDCPAYYDATLDKFISPILADGTVILSVDDSNKLTTDSIWTTEPWDQWFANYQLQIDSVEIINGGSGYTIVPEVVVTGNSITPAELTAVLGPGGQVTSVIVDNPGSGYSTTPTISFTGSDGSGATAYAIMNNALVRTIKVTVKWDRTDYTSTVTDWLANTAYTAGDLVRVGNTVYEIVDTAPAATFDPLLHTEVDIETLSGIDRTAGYYTADVNNPGLDLSLLIKGISFPGVEVYGPDFTDADLDTIYESSFLDTYLGTGTNDVNVEGGAFVDTYHSHAPEELVPGRMFDTFDLKVFSRPGADANGDGHGWAVKSTTITASASTESFSFLDATSLPIAVFVVNLTTGTSLYENRDYTIDWPNQEVDVTSGISASDLVKVFVYELGGGNQLHRATLTGADTTADAFTIPVDDDEIYEVLVYVNGAQDTGITVTGIDAYSSTVTLSSTPTATDFITVVVMGFTAPIQYEESFPVTQTFVYGTDTPDVGAAALADKNRHNAIVELNGFRLRPPEARRHIGDGVTVNFLFPADGGYLYDGVADNEVDVYVGNTQLELGIDYTVSPPTPPAIYGSSVYGSGIYYDGGVNTPRFVTLTTAPAAGESVDVYVRYAADYWWTGGTNSEVEFLAVTPSPGDIVAVTTFKDIREQDALTEVGVGNSFLEIDREIIIDSNRLWVTLNGARLTPNADYIIVDNNTVSVIPFVGASDVVAVTSFTNSVVTDGVNFRIFKDMRDNYAAYTLADSSKTYLTQALASTDDIIYVNDASVLGIPDLVNGTFGILTVNGERITYRVRDTVANTVSGLRRGTAGTGASDHGINDVVYDVSEKSLVPISEPISHLGKWDYATTYMIGDIVYYGGVYWHAYDTPTLGEFNLTEWSRYEKIWYAHGDTTASNGIPLQEQTTVQANFLKN